MACGCPVLTSTDPALTEVANGAARHVDPNDTDAITQALLTLLETPEERATLQQKGLTRAKHFTSKRMAQAALDGYQKALR
jgi:glycosyltransferase involved in cell wall biosynthesis